MPFLQCRLAIPFPMSPQMSSKAQSLPAVAPLCPSHAYAASLGDLLPAPSFPCTAFFPEEVSVPSGRAARCPAKYRHPGHGQRPNVAVVGGRGCRPRIPPGTRSSSRVVAAACVHMYARVCLCVHVCLHVCVWCVCVYLVLSRSGGAYAAILLRRGLGVRWGPREASGRQKRFSKSPRRLGPGVGVPLSGRCLRLSGAGHRCSPSCRCHQPAEGVAYQGRALGRPRPAAGKSIGRARAPGSCCARVGCPVRSPKIRGARTHI